MTALTGKVALVTGASRGFGHATALLLARHGADLVLNYRSSADEAERTAEAVRAFGRRAEVVRADVADAEAVESLVGKAIESFGRIDILVNNAGVLDIESFRSQDAAIWRTMMDVNILGTLLPTHRVLPHMIAGGGGRIVNLASQLAHVGGDRFAVYAGTKAFVRAFTQSLAREEGPNGITVNAVCPGSIVTDMNRSIYDPEQQLEKARSLPLRRLGSPDDVAEAVLFLAAGSGRFITGQCIDVNGGSTIA